MTEIVRVTKNELIEHVANLAFESFDRFDTSDTEGLDQDALLATIFESQEKGGARPEDDMDRNSWINILGLGFVGYLQQGKELGKSLNKETFIRDLEAQLTADHLRFGDTWKERSPEGQLGRTYARFKDYKDQYKNGQNQSFPWLKLSGNVIIDIVRIDHPEYQK